MPNEHEEDNKIIDTKSQNLSKDKKWVKYLFSRTEFNSRSTDLCNTLLLDVCPIAKDNALAEILEAITLLTEKQNWNTLSKFKWYDKEDESQKQAIIFSALTLKLFPNQKWDELKARLQQDFEEYQKLPQNEKNKYLETLNSKFKPTENKIISTLIKNPQKLEKL